MDFELSIETSKLTLKIMSSSIHLSHMVSPWAQRELQMRIVFDLPDMTTTAILELRNAVPRFRTDLFIASIFRLWTLLTLETDLLSGFNVPFLVFAEAVPFLFLGAIFTSYTNFNNDSGVLDFRPPCIAAFPFHSPDVLSE